MLCDTEVLATLPPREYASGLGEMAKYHFLTGVDLADLPLDERVAECVRIKADLVVKDDHARRASGPCSTTATPWPTPWRSPVRHDLRHGEAVAVGLVFAAELARGLERIDDARVADHRRVVAGYGLPTTVDGDLDPATLVELMRPGQEGLRRPDLRARRPPGPRDRHRCRGPPGPRRPRTGPPVSIERRSRSVGRVGPPGDEPLGEEP